VSDLARPTVADGSVSKEKLKNFARIVLVGHLITFPMEMMAPFGP
jgi:hypothetical protein